MRDKKAERKLLSDLYLRNLLAKYSDLNRESYPSDTIPEVGIFWMGESGTPFFKESIPLTKATVRGDLRIIDKAHYDVWSEARQIISKWSDMEHDQIPRGSVVHSSHPRCPGFKVYLPKALMGFESEIAKAFLLPVKCTVFDYSDEDYPF